MKPTGQPENIASRRKTARDRTQRTVEGRKSPVRPGPISVQEEADVQAFAHSEGYAAQVAAADDARRIPSPDEREDEPPQKDARDKSHGGG
jgi:hypothetical protein